MLARIVEAARLFVVTSEQVDGQIVTGEEDRERRPPGRGANDSRPLERHCLSSAPGAAIAALPELRLGASDQPPDVAEVADLDRGDGDEAEDQVFARGLAHRDHEHQDREPGRATEHGH